MTVPAFIFDAFQAFFLITPILSMFWRSIAFKGLNVVRGLIRMTLYFIIRTLGLGAIAPLPPRDKDSQRKLTRADGEKEVEAAKPNAPLRYFVATLTTIDTMCIHARGWMQALPSLVKLSPLNVGPTNTFIYWCEVEYHAIFFIVYYITMHVPKATKMRHARIVVWLMRFFGWSDVTKNAAWMWLFGKRLHSLLGRLLPLAFAFMAMPVSQVLGTKSPSGAIDVGLWKSETVYEDAFAKASFMSIPEQLIAVFNRGISNPDQLTLWYNSEVSESDQLAVAKAFLGIIITSLDIYSYLRATKAHPLVLASIQISSALFYCWIAF